MKKKILIKLAFAFLSTMIFLSCTQEKQYSNVQYNTNVVEAKGYEVPADSIIAPKEIAVIETKLKKTLLGKPKVVPANINMQLVKKPKIVIVGEPRVIVFGKDTFSFPKSISAKINPFVAGTPQVVAVKDAKIKDPNPQNFSTFGKFEGLKHILISCMLEDNFGNIWFGTNGGGVSKYDGKYFTHFTENEGLSNNQVLSNYQDHLGNLWFGTNGGGVSKFDGKYFTNFTIKEGLSNNIVNSIVEDYAGNLWFGTNGGVNKFDGKTFTHFTEKEGLSNNHVNCVLEDKAKNLWFGTNGGGVNKFDGKSFTHFTEKEGLSNNQVLSILEDHFGNFWFGTYGGGVNKFDGSFFTHFTEKEGLNNNIVNSILEDNEGNLWLGTNGGGVNKYDGKNFSHFTEKEGLSHNFVLSSLEDSFGNLWFGTNSGGVSKFDGKIFTHFTEKEGLNHNQVLSMAKDHKGNYWFGTNGGGVSKYDGKTFTYFTEKEGLNHNVVWSIVEDHAGNLWFGTFGGGVSKFDGKTFTHFTQKDGLTHNQIWCMTEDHAGNLWFGTNGGGVSKFDGKTFTNFTQKEGLSNNFVFNVFEDSAKNLWFGTNGGLNKYDRKIFTHFNEKERFGRNQIRTIAEDHAGNLWLGTFGGGVCKYDGKTFTYFTEKEGLSNNFVFSILEDHSNNLWFGSRFGLNQLSPAKLADFSEKIKSANFKESDVFFKKYIYEDGFLGIGCFAKSISEDKNGTIWIGANDRLTACHLAENSLKVNKIKGDSTPPNIQIIGIELFNEKIAWTNLEKKKDSTIILGNGVRVKNLRFDSTSKWYGLPQQLDLAYNNNHLTFHFIGITMNQPKQVKYQYKLEGIDDNWSALSNRSEATYGNLTSDFYTFKVKAMNSMGYWSEEFQYSFVIRPPWWKTWWAYLIYAFVFIGILRGYIIFRSRQLRKMNQELEEKVEVRTKALEEKSNELKSSLDNLKATQKQLIQSEKLASLGELTAGIAHEIQNPLNFVNNFAEMSVSLAKELNEEIKNSPLTPDGGIIIKDKEYFEEIISDLTQNQEKINHHGKRASSIVTGMLQHSQASSGKKELTDINKLADESLRLSYHGLRAKDKSFNSDFELIADPNLPKINVIPQDIGRVLINLINNAFYATTAPNPQRRTVPMGASNYIPKVTVSTSFSAPPLGAGGAVIRVSDNGTGMSEAVKAKIFQPFFTTKPTGQGTGLGLSLAYDIITKGHGGTLEVETKEGEGSEFIIILPTQNNLS